MASLTLNFSIGDVFTPIKETIHSVISRDKRETFIHAFDQIALRVIAVIILLATTILTIMCVPYIIQIIETLLLSLQKLPNILVQNPNSIVQLASVLPLMFMLVD